MKKLFVLAIATGMFVACNNATSTSNDSTNVSADSAALNQAPPAGDSAVTLDSSATAPVDSAAHTDSTHKH